MAKEWKITIKPPIRGFAPGWWKNSYPSYGDKDMVGDMQNVNVLDPTVFTQGPGLANLTNGTESVAVTTLIKHILPVPLTSDATYGIGGAKLYKLSSTTVISEAGPPAWPHTIDKAVVTGEDGESVCSYGTNLLYFYNHSGSAGDIGKFDGASFDDDWGSTVPTGMAVLQNAPHPSVLGGDGIVYFGNGPYVGYYDPVTNTLSVDELDLPAGSQVVDIRWQNSVLFIAINYPNLSGSNANIGIIYVWDTISNSWLDSPNPKIMGTIGALYIKDGIVFVWYQDLSSSGFKLGYINGNRIDELTNFTGSLPNFGQVGEYENLIAWISGGEVWVFGGVSKLLPAVCSQLADGGYSTVGAFAMPFGTPLIASTQATSYKLAKFSGYDTNCHLYSLMFDVAISQIDKVDIFFETLSTGARCDLTLRYNRGVSILALARTAQVLLGNVTANKDTDTFTKTAHGLLNGQRVVFGGTTMPTGITAGTAYYIVNKTDNTFQVSETEGGGAVNFTTNGSGINVSTIETGSVSYTNDGARTRKTFTTGLEIDDFRLELSWANGSATNPVKIRKIRIKGHFLDKD